MSGILLGLFAGYTYSEQPAGWRSMYDIALLSSAVLATGMVRLMKS